MQSDLLTLVADVLGLSPDEISRRADTASFIQLGGTSLRAAELIALARKGFGTDVPVSVLLSDSVLATALAAGRPVSVPLEDSRPAIIGQFRAVSAGQASMLLSDDLGAGSP